MKRNKIRRSIVVEQTRTVRKLFVENNIDLALVDSGRSLYQCLRNAKHRTKTRADYIAKGIRFMFNLKDRLALLEVIKGDNAFWLAWILQDGIFKRTGLEADRPTIHRLDSNGHYEFGNIAVLPQGEHQQEHAQPRVSFVPSKDENGAVIVEKKRFRSITATVDGLGLKSDKKAKQFSFHDARAELEARNKVFFNKLK